MKTAQSGPNFENRFEWKVESRVFNIMRDKEPQQAQQEESQRNTI